MSLSRSLARLRSSLPNVDRIVCSGVNQNRKWCLVEASRVPKRLLHTPSVILMSNFALFKCAASEKFRAASLSRVAPGFCGRGNSENQWPEGEFFTRSINNFIILVTRGEPVLLTNPACP